MFPYRLMLPDSTFDLLESIATKHRDGDYTSTTEDERKVLDQIGAAIKDGDIELYPMKALLAASNDWNTGLITRMGLYKNILLEGIDKGTLAPGNEYAWEWIGAAATNNDPEEFVDDKTLYYDLLSTAAESGVTIALDIMDRIWEPEDIIEED